MNRLALLLLLGFIGRAHADGGLYDAIGRPIALPAVELPGTVTRNAAGLPHVVSIGDLDTTYTYNAHGEVLTETTTDGPGVVFARTYTRDALGRITQVEETEGANTRKLFYNYDIAGRLVAECEGTAAGQGDDACGPDTALIAEYAYDANGNRQSRDEPGGDVDEEAEYDAQDRLVDYDGVAHTFGDRGELQSAGTWSFDYDAMGNLVQASKPGLTVSYLIDPQNRRIGRDDGVTQRYWLYQDQLEPLAELDGNGALVARFVYGVRAHSPDYMVRWEGGNEVLYRYITDHLGSVRMVVKVSTGAVVQRLDYDAFGRVLDDTNPGFQPFGFAGGLYDADTGLVRFGARDYDPQTGRWTAKDPIRWEGGQANLYEYVSSDPVNGIDPSGLYLVIEGGDLSSLSLPPPTESILHIIGYALFSDFGSESAVASFSSGLGNALTFGAASALASALAVDDLVDEESIAYGWGGVCGTALGAALGSGGFLLRPFTGSAQSVTRWYHTHEGLRSGAWVMTGERSMRNWIMSGVAAPGRFHRPFKQAVTHVVPGSSLQWPPGREMWKGLLGQRVYRP